MSGFFLGPDQKPSMGRLLSLIATLAGVLVLLAGAVCIFTINHGGTELVVSGAGLITAAIGGKTYSGYVESKFQKEGN